MARSRKKAVEAPAAEITSPEPTPAATADVPDIFDEQIALRKQEKAAENFTMKAATPPEAEPAPNGFAARTYANGHIANPSSRKRSESHVESVARRLPDKLTVVAGDLKVQMIDKGDNLAGIGIRVVVPEGRTLSDQEKDVIRSHTKGADGEQTGYLWNRDVGMWHKAIVRENEFEDQIPLSRPVAIRLDCERRVAAIAEDLRQLQADPVGFAEMVQQRRERAAEAGRIPD